jgi:effector-binding domain-containing protein
VSLVTTLEDRPECHYVGIPATARLAEFGAVNALIPQIYGWLADHGLTPAGGPLYRYMSIGSLDEPVDISVNVPVAQPVEASQGLTAGSLPAGRYVVGRHQGSPDEVKDAHRAVQDWARARGVSLAVRTRDGREYWRARAEFYLTDPQVEPDMSKWRNELVYLVS